jgi:hypothetical protein
MMTSSERITTLTATVDQLQCELDGQRQQIGFLFLACCGLAGLLIVIQKDISSVQ